MRRERRGQDAPHWRTILEARWRDRLAEVTELSLAYHSAAEPPGAAHGDERSRRLLRGAVAARRRLADTEDALKRLTAGSFGECEECGAPIPHAVLAAVPETRYCPACVAGTRRTLPRKTTIPAPRDPVPSPPARELIPVPRVPADLA
jgi:RNA polymerase-binding transcription factor DksA